MYEIQVDNDCGNGNFNFIVSLHSKILHKPRRQNSQETHYELNRIILKTESQSEVKKAKAGPGRMDNNPI